MGRKESVWEACKRVRGPEEEEKNYLPGELRRERWSALVGRLGKDG